MKTARPQTKQVAAHVEIGVRETRRVHGDYRLTREDVLGARRFDDEVGLCGAPIEDHHPGADTTWQYLPDGEVVGIPYRTLLVRDSSNTLVAGRCFSATHDAHASVRSMAQTMAMGQAAGTAAALASTNDLDPRAVDVTALRERLRNDGAVLESAHARRIATEAARETARVARHLDEAFFHCEEDAVQRLEQWIQKNADRISPFLQDFRRRKRTEVDFVNGVIARIAKTAALPTPVNRLLRDLVLAKEETYYY